MKATIIPATVSERFRTHMDRYPSSFVSRLPNSWNTYVAAILGSWSSLGLSTKIVELHRKVLNLSRASLVVSCVVSSISVIFGAASKGRSSVVFAFKTSIRPEDREHVTHSQPRIPSNVSISRAISDESVASLPAARLSSSYMKTTPDLRRRLHPRH